MWLEPRRFNIENITQDLKDKFNKYTGMKLIKRHSVWQRVRDITGTNKYILKTRPQNFTAEQDPLKLLQQPFHLKAGDTKLF